MPAIDEAFAQQIKASPILIVDDNEINRLFLEKILRAKGFSRLVTASSAEEAQSKMQDTAFDMVLLDIIMPGGMNGFDCCEMLRSNERYRDLPILVQTSITEPELRVKAFAKGATDFVSKPIYPEELCARVTAHLENRQSMKALRHYKKRIESELDSARLLQQAIMPDRTEIEHIERSCHLNIASYFEPSSEIGGDFWGVKNLFPHQTAFWMVDFSGHGVASALNAFRLQAYLKEHSTLAARPGDYLSSLNDKLLHLLLRGQFATMFYGIIDTQSHQLFYACACSPAPIILRRATGRAEQLDGSGSLLGVGMHLYNTQSIPFAHNDTLLLYSDALIETPNADGAMITEEQLMELIEQHAGASASALKEIVLDYFRAHAGDNMRDDLTLMICARSGT
jgi:sigma-B regulation protein RsbU (phosphoserine phosphatase)